MNNFAFLVGVGNYENPTDFNEYPFIINHVLELEQILIDSGKYSAGNIKKLITGHGEEIKPTRGKIINELSTISEKTKEGDHLLVYFIGHGGFYDDDNYLYPYGAHHNKSNPNVLKDTSISFKNHVKKYLKDSHLKDIIVIVDACRDKVIAAGGMTDNKKSGSENTQDDKVEQEFKIDDEFGKPKIKPKRIDLSSGDSYNPSGISWIFSCSQEQKSYFFKNEKSEQRSTFSQALTNYLAKSKDNPLPNKLLKKELKDEVKRIYNEYNAYPQDPNIILGDGAEIYYGEFINVTILKSD
ncbi:MAG: hypothetical protein HeimC3_39340 [Candidatus Heimdallarchaeota archaeon LC_3]|nr:MAG: hypothetical protein HeimC3_39340 [Candidatus Heimdallarchaeota archaeon LC_3]